jgi:heme-degrading monooxygenase HmoA
MIARLWKGRTLAEKAPEYREYVKRTGLKDYAQTDGNHGAFLLERTENGITEFLVLSFWDSYAAIKRFAGEDFQKARYYARDAEFLLEFEPTVSHFEVPFSTSAITKSVLRQFPDLILPF